MNIFFACGAPKSGTTWLQRVLDAHPEVCCSGEGHFIQRFSAPIAKSVNAYNRELVAVASQVYEGEPYYQPVGQPEFDALIRDFILGRLSARAGPQTRWIGDKTPTYTRHLEQLNRLFPGAKVIHIVRDPRDVAVSRMAHSRRAGAGAATTPGSEEHRLTLEGAVRMWREAVSAVDAFAAAHPGQTHELRYRDLHTDPIGEIGRLFGFLGAPAPRVLVQRIAAQTSFKALSGRAPGEEDASSFLRKGLPDDWRSGLDEASARFVTDECGELMRAKRFAA
ncbi:MAG: sulfotransferase domain-containing protein [Phenylobacterium sp.]